MRFYGPVLLLLLPSICLTVSVHQNLSSSHTVGNGVFEAFRRIASLPLDFVLNGGNVSDGCRIESELLGRGIKDTEFWALKILDASAKVPSGILSGNLNQLGDFDLCLSAQSDIVNGQYCLADVDITLSDENLSHIDDRIHAFRSMTSQLNDPGQRLPKLGSFRWGLCVPSGCNAADVAQHFQHHLTSKLHQVANVDLRVDPDLCYTTRNRPIIGIGHYLAIAVFAVLALCVITGTLLPDPLPTNAAMHQKIVSHFSLQKNWRDLVKTTSEGEDIPIVHGGRALNALALLLSHKQMAQLYNPFVNALEIGKSQSGAWSMIGRAAILYTDSFILISGLLTSFSMIKELDREKKLNVKRSFITRYVRFTPNLLIIILACTYLTDFLGPGPQWGLVVSKYSNLCKHNMWRNFLYIHNYFGFEEMCLTHTHQLGIDMQLFLVSPIFVYLLWKHPKIGGFALLAVATASTWLRYIVTIQQQLSTVIFYGVSVDRLFRTARLSYILPTHRATVYCMGLLLGYGARRGLRQMPISASAAIAGWSVAVLFAVLAMFGPAHMAIRGYVYDVHDAAIYNALAPIIWCLFLSWGTIASWNNQGGWFNAFLSWKYFIIFSRISYAVYLVQFPIFFYQVGTQRSSMFFEGLATIIDIKELAIIIGSSVLLTITVDLPFQGIRKMLLSSQKLQEMPGKGKISDPVHRIINHG